MNTNTLLVLIIALLTINLLFVGVYIVLVLKEVRETIKKANEVLETVNQVTAAVATPVMGAMGAVSALTQGLKAYNIIKKFRGVSSGEEED